MMIAGRGTRPGGSDHRVHDSHSGEREVGERADLLDVSGAVGVRAARPGGGIGERPGLRMTLLSLAVAILVLGAAVAGAFGYHLLGSG
jgi:hypothetical protein